MNQSDFDLAIRLLHVYSKWAIENCATPEFESSPVLKDPLWPKSPDLLDDEKYSNDEPLNEEILELLSRHPYKAP